MDIIFSHETALQICSQLKIHGNDEVLSQRLSRDFRATYSACSDEVYEEILRFLKKEYCIVLSKTTHEILRDNSRTRFSETRVSHQFKCLLPAGFLIDLGQNIYCVTPSLAVCLLSRNKSALHQIVLANLMMASYGHLPNGDLCEFNTPLLTTDELTSLLSALDSYSPGLRTTQRNMRYFFSDAASPMEVKMALRSALPYQEGGFNQMPLALNKSYLIKDLINPGVQAKERKLDLLFGKISKSNLSGLNLVAIEYNGAYHDDFYQQRKDNQRTNELNSVSIKEYFVNADIYRNQLAMQNMFLSIKKDLGDSNLYRIRQTLRQYSHEQFILMNKLDSIYKLTNELIYKF